MQDKACYLAYISLFYMYLTNLGAYISISLQQIFMQLPIFTKFDMIHRAGSLTFCLKKRNSAKHDSVGVVNFKVFCGLFWTDILVEMYISTLDTILETQCNKYQKTGSDNQASYFTFNMSTSLNYVTCSISLCGEHAPLQKTLPRQTALLVDSLFAARESDWKVNLIVGKLILYLPRLWPDESSGSCSLSIL